MKTTEKIGVWMDYSHAILTEFSQVQKKPAVVESPHSSKGNAHGSENQAHNKKHDNHIALFKKIEAALTGYGEVLLFGPTHAKQEFANFLKKTHTGQTMKITVKDADKMSENQMFEMTRKFFEPIVFRSL